MKQLSLHLDLAQWADAPKIDDYVCTVGTKGVGTLYQIKEITSIIPREHNQLVRYNLLALKAPKLLNKVSYNPASGHITIDLPDAIIFPI